MKRIILIISIVFLFSCNNTNSQVIFPYQNLKSISIKKASDKLEYVVRDKDLINLIESQDHISNFKGYNSIYYHCKFNEKLFTIYVVCQNYEGIFLVDSRNSNLYELSGGVCLGGPEELNNGKIKWCDEKESIIMDDKIKITVYDVLSNGFDDPSEERVKKQEEIIMLDF